MAEKTSKVHDVLHPSPVSLQELAAIAVSHEVWRCEMNDYRQNDKMSTFIPALKEISLKSRLPDLPSVILEIIKKYLTIFGNSMAHWLVDHHKILHFYYSHQNTVLRYFDGFVCDNFGMIDYVKTAESMIRCDTFLDREKFDIACAYFFEDYIEQLWPSVSINTAAGANLRKLRILRLISRETPLDGINYHERPHLYYWICRLTNQLDQIPIQENNTIDDEMFDQRIPRIGPSMTYFLDRIPIENRMRKAISVANSCPESAVRFILPKLNDQQLSQFVFEEGVNFIHNLWSNVADYGENLFLATWSYLGNVMHVTNFANLVVKMLEINYEYDDNNARVYCNYLFGEMWNITRFDLKQSVMNAISTEMLDDMGFSSDYESSITFDVEFLSIMTDCTSSVDKMAFFWRCWHLLITVTPIERLQRLMKLCFDNDDELIAEFKRVVMIEDDDLQDCCISLLRDMDFELLNELASFCCPDSQTARIFKQRLLRLAFVLGYVENGDYGENSTLYIGIVDKPKEFNQFIDEVYHDVDLSNDFKNQLLSFNQLQLCQFACSGYISIGSLIEFIDTLAPTDQNIVEIKLRMVNVLREDCERNPDSYSTSRRVYAVIGALLPFLYF